MAHGREVNSSHGRHGKNHLGAHKMHYSVNLSAIWCETLFFWVALAVFCLKNFFIDPLK
jgi:hypothetical protein